MLVIRVLVQRLRVGLALLETDAAVLVEIIIVAVALAVEDAADVATRVATGAAGAVIPPRPGHDVAQFDPARLSVPKADADEQEDDGAKGHGQGDDDVPVLQTMRLLRTRVTMLVEIKVDDGVCLVDFSRAELANHEGEGDILRDGALVLLEVVVLDLEGEEPPLRAERVGLVEPLPLAVVGPVDELVVVGGLLVGGALQVVEAGGDAEGGVLVGLLLLLGLVEEVRVPGY